MTKKLSLMAVVALCVSGLFGCGGVVEEQEQPGVAISSTGQTLYQCVNDGTMSGKCPTGYTCAGGTCRPLCSSTSTCPSGQRCCLGYVYPDGSVMQPYCLSTFSSCYLPPGAGGV